MARDASEGCIVISLQILSVTCCNLSKTLPDDAERSHRIGWCHLRGHAYLDDAGDKAHHFGELAHVNIEMAQLILDSLRSDDSASLSHGSQTAQVASWVQIRVRRTGQIDLGNVWGEGRQRRVWSRRVARVIGAGR